MSALTEEQRANMVRWIAALRGDEYPQGRGQLRSADDKFCPIGVACDIIGAHGEHRFASFWREELITHFGLEGGEMSALITMNDLDRKSFAEIADYLEGKYLTPEVTT